MSEQATTEKGSMVESLGTSPPLFARTTIDEVLSESGHKRLTL